LKIERNEGKRDSSKNYYKKERSKGKLLIVWKAHKTSEEQL